MTTNTDLSKGEPSKTALPGALNTFINATIAKEKLLFSNWILQKLLTQWSTVPSLKL